MYEDSIYSQFIYKSRYARWIDKEKRREEWSETVGRYMTFINEYLKDNHEYNLLSTSLYGELYDAILNHDVMPSMRALMTAGKAAEKNHIAMYNCSYAPIEDVKNLDETMAIAMSGTGVGYSVESQYVKNLPEIPDQFFNSETVIVFDDSRIGWAKGFREFISLLLVGQIPKWDVSKLRPAGARLKTMGGRSSGPEPLIKLLQFTINIFKHAAGRKLTTLEAHDLECMVGDIVVVGGVRRCLIGSTRVQTAQGYKEIKDLNVDDILIVRGKERKVIEKVYSGKQPVYKIKHKFGEIKGATAKHEVAVFSSMDEYDFKPVSSLNKGDVLVWDAYGISGSSQKLPLFVQNNHYNAHDNVSFPEFLDDDLAWLIGLIQGDGYISEKTIEISGNIDDWDVLEYAKSIFEEYFNLQGNLGKDSHGGKGIRLRINSTSLASWFQEFIKRPNKSISVPNFIFAASRDIRYAYLAGLFDADGRVTIDGGVDQVTTVYEGFKNDIQTLLSNLGIGCNVYFANNNKRRTSGVNAKNHYTIRIKGRMNRNIWDNILKYSQSKKKRNTKEYVGKNNDFSWPRSLHKIGNGFKEDMSFLTAIERGLTINHGIYPTKILSITELGEEDTYDIEVDEVHEFVIDGIIVHNSAFISLSDLLDDRMRNAKTGNWYTSNPYRRLANNSAVYNEKPDIGVFMREWLSLYESKSGERGIFSRVGTQNVIKNANKFRAHHSMYATPDDVTMVPVRFRELNHAYGTNPCSEIILRPYEFCNLTEVVVYEDDTPVSIKNKVRLATILGTFQSCFTNFKYLNKKWQKNCEDERLLGVSLTGIMDNSYTSGAVPVHHDGTTFTKFLENLKLEAIKTNIQFAEKLNINSSVAITCVKPSGTSSALNGTSSGIHPAHSPYYIRYVRNDTKDPLTGFMIDHGFPFEKDAYDPANVVSFKFPIKSAEAAICKNNLTAIEHLELWKIYQIHWCEHKPSITVSVKEDEWLKVGAWVYENFEWVSGISFLPAEEGSTVYQQAPFTECNEDEYKDLLSKMPLNVDWTDLTLYELEDSTTATQELACTSGGCGF